MAIVARAGGSARTWAERPAWSLALVAVSLVLAGNAPRRRRGCPTGSVAVENRFCVDRYEGALRELLAGGRTRAWSPYHPPERGRRYVAVSRRGVVPQGYISQVQARAACEAAGKRLCAEREWETACRGPRETAFPYGARRERGACNDGRENPVPRVFRGSRDVFHFPQMNDPRLNALPASLARTGEFARCTNRYGARDMVGNLHEWVEARRGSNGVFRGGFYADTWRHGQGCSYITSGHSPTYHDYSTGFRCCADLR